MIGAVLLSSVALVPVTTHPVSFACDLFATAPAPREVPGARVIVVGPNWTLDERFAKLTGMRQLISEPQGDTKLLTLRGDAAGNRLSGVFSFEDEANGAFALDWRVVEGEGPDAPLVNSGVGLCRLAPPSAQTGPSGL